MPPRMHKSMYRDFDGSASHGFQFHTHTNSFFFSWDPKRIIVLYYSLFASVDRSSLSNSKVPTWKWGLWWEVHQARWSVHRAGDLKSSCTVCTLVCTDRCTLLADSILARAAGGGHLYSVRLSFHWLLFFLAIVGLQPYGPDLTDATISVYGLKVILKVQERCCDLILTKNRSNTKDKFVLYDFRIIPGIMFILR